MTELPYGLWRRQARRTDLDAFERKARDADEAWDLRHPEEADRLDAMIGHVVRLRRRMEAFPNPATGEGRAYPKGCRLTVQGRVRDMILALPSDEATPLLLKPDWIELATETP